jgi:acyl-CoA synthetase (AMP-forming)/AMP-acid ligase II
MPRYIEVHESLPLTATGSVRKDLLRTERAIRRWDLEALGLRISVEERRG